MHTSLCIIIVLVIRICSLNVVVEQYYLFKIENYTV